MPNGLTVVTIAQNEEVNIARCLDSARGVAAEHIVIDGGSTDRTRELARAGGARVLNRPYRYSADQYNYGLSQAGTEWVFILDADEVLDADLRAELSALAAPGGVTAYSVRRKNLFVGRWVRHGAWYPDVNIRLLRVGAAHYENRQVHARVITDGTVGELRGHIVHRTYRSISQYLVKLDKFTEREVKARAVVATTDSERKARLRSLWIRTPFKPLTRFLVDYVLRAGFLDGRVGLDIAVSAAYYEYVVGMKARYPATDE